jgi:hypothetical protein
LIVRCRCSLIFDFIEYFEKEMGTIHSYSAKWVFVDVEFTSRWIISLICQMDYLCPLFTMLHGNFGKECHSVFAGVQ